MTCGPLGKSERRYLSSATHLWHSPCQGTPLSCCIRACWRSELVRACLVGTLHWLANLSITIDWLASKQLQMLASPVSSCQQHKAQRNTSLHCQGCWYSTIFRKGSPGRQDMHGFGPWLLTALCYVRRQRLMRWFMCPAKHASTH